MAIGTLIFFCGKMGSGKSTLANQMTIEGKNILLSEDEWLTSLYPDAITTLEDYLHYSSLLREPVKELVQSILLTGTDVVMDFPANTRKQRAWFQTLFAEVNANHRLVYLQADDDICLQRIARRAVEEPHRTGTDTESMFYAVTQYFHAPTDDEGFTLEKMIVD